MSDPVQTPPPFQPQPSYQQPPPYQQQASSQQPPFQPVAVQPASAQSGLSDNAAGGLAYITIIPAIIFLIVAPYNRNRFIRFHSWQCIFLAVAWIVVDVGLVILGRIPGVGLLDLVIGPLVGIAFFIVWLIAMIQAFNGKMFKLPVLGDFAEKQANS
ncbi:MAG TPA: hypothetical protein VF730_09720 [Terracidiphilus sp.]